MQESMENLHMRKQVCLGAGLIFFVLLGCLWSHREFYEGEAYGFVIGWTKEQCYEQIHLQMQKNKKMELRSTYHDSNKGRTEFERTAQGKLIPVHPSKISTEKIERWNEWRIEQSDERVRKRIVIAFRDDVLERIMYNDLDDAEEGQYVSNWPIDDQAALKVGQRRAQVLQAMARLPQGYEIRPYETSRRFPLRADADEYWMISDEDEWQIFPAGWHVANRIDLKFENGVLRKISRTVGETT